MSESKTQFPRTLAFGAVLAALAMIFGGLWALDQRPDPNFKPEVNQPGKDVVWVPTPDALVAMMLKEANVTPNDYVVDLGAGDGKIVIAAARDFGARAHGVEYNPDLVALAQRKAQEAGVSDKATFEKADIFTTDFSKATVLTLYLLPRLNEKLRPIILKMKPGTRVVSHAFDMGDWRADRTFAADGRQGFLWIVPANVQGAWQIPLTTGEQITVRLTQTFQTATGVADVATRETPVKDVQISGPTIAFTVDDWRGGAWRVTGAIDGDTLKGGVARDGGAVERFFEAKRA
ncbi:MAG: SAM-dependent methyltransferase [Caulobacterales bacterium]